MDITPYVDHLRRDLTAAAQAGGEELQAAAERLAYALDPAARLALMEAISQAAAEITTEMPNGSVDVRLNGRELDFVVEQAPPAGVVAAPTPAPLPPGPEDPDEGLARVTLRLPESVKAKAEEQAAQSGHSLNTWLVNVVRHATNDNAINIDLDLSSIPFLGGADPFGRPGRSGRGTKHMTGWI
ncbi:toxin-antitoxin system HicB family antitoxin [Nocardioides sp. 616]|uniref:toxin-antitoxin system HicB family antitoxin n=1 Tax=Nocardioides sp. 616 TaxID=2268090 RepID=UPI000CE3B9DB|nr:toxin-antitoxin system HicB family antitoxin [Nocardioides sp. 616]